MIKRYVLHIEAHKRHLPRISFKRVPRHGDHVVDGGIPGTLKLCPMCQEGFLHEPDPVLRRPRPKAPPKQSLLASILAELAKNMVQRSASPVRPARSHHTPRPAMDWNAPSHVELKVKEEKPQDEHVELTVEEPDTHVELKETKKKDKKEKKSDTHVEIEVKDESPEELKLDYTLGNREYNPSDRVWTHKAWYIVEKLEDDVLYLVREDVWKERQKKAKHVELTVDEHVELTTDDEVPEGQIVELNFE